MRRKLFRQSNVVDIIYRPRRVDCELRDSRKVLLYCAFSTCKDLFSVHSIVLVKFYLQFIYIVLYVLAVVYKVIGACVNQSEYTFDLSFVHCN